ncbi:MAG TPA: sporulation protein YunB [Ruminococcus sp.]|nr:sporulation protein YunB [Ruminococcus sp.]
MRRRRPAEKRRRLLFRAAAGLLLGLAVMTAVHAEKKAGPIAREQAEMLARHTAGNVISQTVSDYLEENPSTACDLAAVLYDEEGRPASVEAIPYNINKVQAELSLAINRRLEQAGEVCARIPLGSLWSSYLLAGKGPSVRVRICPAGDVSVRLRSSFTSAGINQTCHRIYAEITAEMSAALPLYSFQTSQSFQFLLAESVLVGETPKISPYLN